MNRTLSTPHPSWLSTLIVLGCILTPGALGGQVSLAPSTIMPGAWERITLRVVNQTDTVTTGVRLTVPETIGILGVERSGGWNGVVNRASESSPQTIEWTGDSLVRGEYRDFAFLGRLSADARRRTLVFPVALTKGNGSVVEWGRGTRGAAAPEMNIVGTTRITTWGTFGLASVAVGIAVISLGVAISGRGRRNAATDQR